MERIVRNDSQAVAKVVKLTEPDNTQTGLTLKINNKTITLSAWDIANIVTTFNASDLAEFGEIEAAAVSDGITFTARTAGVDFEMSAEFDPLSSAALTRIRDYAAAVYNPNPDAVLTKTRDYSAEIPGQTASATLTKTQSYIAPHTGTPLTANWTKTQSHIAPTSQTFDLEISSDNTGGAFTLMNNGVATANIDYDTTATELETAFGEYAEETVNWFAPASSYLGSFEPPSETKRDFIGLKDSPSEVGFIHFISSVGRKLTTFTNVTMSLTASSPKSASTVRIRAVKHHNPLQPSTLSAFQALQLTSAYVDWSVPATTADVSYTSPNLDTIVAEVLSAHPEQTNLMFTFECLSGSVNFYGDGYSPPHVLSGTANAIDNWNVTDLGAGYGFAKRFRLERVTGTGTLSLGANLLEDNYSGNPGTGTAPTITETVAGSNGQPDIYTLELANVGSGDFTIHNGVNSETWNPGSWANPTTTELDLLIESITGLSSGQILVSLNTNTYTITADQAFGATDLTFSHNLVTDDPAVPGTAEQYQLTISGASSGSITLTSNSDAITHSTTGLGSWSLTASQLDALLEGLSDVAVDSVGVDLSGETYTIDIGLENGAIGLSLSESLDDTPTTPAVGEQYTLQVTNSPASGTVTLSSDGNSQTWNPGSSWVSPTESELDSLIESITGIDAGSVSVSLSNGLYTISFDASQEAVALSRTHDLQPSIQTAAIGERYTFEVTGTPDSGTVVFEDGSNTGILADDPWNPTANELKTAVVAAIDGDSGNVSVSESNGVYTIDIEPAEGVSSLSIQSQNFVDEVEVAALTTIQRSTGPLHADDPENYEPQGLPEPGDVLIFDRGKIGLQYGLKLANTFTVNSTTNVIESDLDTIEGALVEVWTDGTLPTGLNAGVYYVRNYNRDSGTLQISATASGPIVEMSDQGTGTHSIGIRLSGIEQKARARGPIGLRLENPAGYVEYRQKFLKVGLRDGSTVRLGTGVGGGSGLTYLDFGPDRADVSVTNTGSSSVSDYPALILLGTNTDNRVEVFNGTVGLATFTGWEFYCERIANYGGDVSGQNVHCGTDLNPGELIGQVSIDPLHFTGRIVQQ